MGVPLTPTGLRARLADGVRFRPEPFGMLAYVARRDHFYALDQPHAALLDRLSSDRPPSSGWCDVAPEDRAAVRRLAAIGVVATDPPTRLRTAAFLPYEDALPLLDKATRSAEADERAFAYALLVRCAARDGDLEALIGAWRRYRELMAALAEELAEDLPPG